MKAIIEHGKKNTWEHKRTEITKDVYSLTSNRTTEP